MRRLYGVEPGGGAGSASVRTNPGKGLEPLRRGQVYVWTVQTEEADSSELASRLEAVLPPAERREARRYRRDVDQRQFVMARALARLALSRHVPVPAELWRFDRDCHGRPFVAAPAWVPPLRFSLSHTRGLIACLITLSAEAAVDAERIEYHEDLSQVARQVLTPEEQEGLSALSERDWTTRFFDHWTLKEAYAKARGLGLALTLSEIGFELKPDSTVGVRFGSQVADDSSAWVFWRCHPSPQHTLSVAVKKDIDHGCKIILRRVTFDDTGFGLAA